MHAHEPKRRRVVAAGHRIAVVLEPPATERLVHLAAHARVVCGDDVMVLGERVVEVLPRRTVLARARQHHDEVSGAQLIAANVDVLGVCCPLDRPLRAGFIERALALAHAGGARPLIVLTKRDVALDLERALDEAQAVAAGAELIAVSAFDHDDVSVLQALVQAPETLVLLGQSGAGKSTLANALFGRPLQATGEVRADDGRGRHTTTRTRLVPLPWGAFLVDTPGVRALGLAADQGDVDAAFPEIDALSASCRFRDCAHEGEPGCAVRVAVDEGRLPAARLASWHKLRAEVARLRAKSDPLAAAGRKRFEKLLSRAVKEVSARKRPRDGGPPTP